MLIAYTSNGQVNEMARGNIVICHNEKLLHLQGWRAKGEGSTRVSEIWVHLLEGGKLEGRLPSRTGSHGRRAMEEKCPLQGMSLITEKSGGRKEEEGKNEDEEDDEGKLCLPSSLPPVPPMSWTY